MRPISQPFAFIYALIGVPLAIMRLQEPYVKREFKLLMRKLRNKKLEKEAKENDDNFSSKPLVIDLRKAMNVELVSLTLIGIDIFMHD